MGGHERPDLEEVRAFYDREANTGLIFRVPEADGLVDRLRSEHDPSRAFGVGSHITILFPFVPREDLDSSVEAEVSRVAGAAPAFDLEFRSVGRFPDVAWLAPEPSDPIRGLIGAVCERWPEHPPYGGQIPDPIPHLTIGHGDEAELDRMEAAVTPGLPVRAHVDTIELIVFDGSWWRLRRRFPLGEAVAR